MKQSLHAKILACTVMPALILAITITSVFLINMFSMNAETIHNHRESLIQSKKQALMHNMQIALNAIEGKTRSEALSILESLRYGSEKQGYFWVNDMGVPYTSMIMHPISPELNGKLLDDPKWNRTKDESGRYLNIFSAFRDVCKASGRGFVDYVWPKPTKQGLTEDRPKSSYVYLYKPFDWVIGTGLYFDEIDEMAALEQARTDQLTKRMLIISASIGGILLMVFIGGVIWLTRRYVIRQIRLIEKTFKNFKNDLTIQAPVVSRDEIGALAQWLNNHISELHDTIADVLQSAEDVDQSTDEISENVEKYASFSNQLMSSIMEISSTMEEFSATATQIADHSGNVAALASHSLNETRKGADAARSVSAKMDEINAYSENNIKAVSALGEKSSEITRIMEFINEIANQTKLIAFNAALEAAGAGESGKRFSVVAVEIRRLAENVVKSTGEIQEKIDEILETVNNMVISAEKTTSVIREGLSYSRQTTGMIAGVVESAENTSSAARQISLSAQQQQSAGKQVVTALNDIKQGGKEGNEAVNRIFEISKELKRLSDTMTGKVGRFKLRDGMDA